MTRYLIVAHQTIESRQLLDTVVRISEAEPEALFGLVVPATPVAHLGSWTEGESQAVAAEAGERARAWLAGQGIDLAEVTVGDANPVYAVADRLSTASWDHVLISTLAPGISRWVKRDVVSRIARETGVPVTHIVAD